jgi:hypothetical protein
MSTPTSIGELSVGVTLDTSKMEAGLKGMERKVKAQTKQLDKEYERMAGGAFGFSGAAGGSRRGGRSNYREMAGGAGGGAAQRLARTFGGAALGRVVGGGGEALMGLGPAAGIAAGVAMMGKLQLSVVNFAKESGKLDNSTLAVIRYGEALSGVGKGVKNVAMGLAVEALGTVNQLGELIGSGFDFASLAASNASDRAAQQAAQRTARTVALNGGGTMADVLARRRASDERLGQFSRDQTFAGAAPKQQQNMLRAEIDALKAKEKTARAAGKILEAEDLRFARLQKVAQLEKNIADFTEAQRQNNDAITRARLERIDADRQAEAERVRESRETLDAVLRATERDVLSSQLDRVRDRIGGARNPFEARSTSDFGSASASTANFAAEGNRLLNEMVRILRAVESNTEDALARN